MAPTLNMSCPVVSLWVILIMALLYDAHSLPIIQVCYVILLKISLALFVDFKLITQNYDTVGRHELTCNLERIFRR